MNLDCPKLPDHFNRKSKLYSCIIIAACLLHFPDVHAQRKVKINSSDKSKVEQLLIADARSSKYRIVIPSSSTQFEKDAATVLQNYLLQISGAALPILTADQSRSPFEIVLGQNERVDGIKPAINFNQLKDDGFIIRTDSLRLIIAGGSRKGTLYGVYTFLEDYLNCRMYSPTVKVIPTKDKIVIDRIDGIPQIPVIGFRDTHYRATWNDEYINWHKLDHDARGERPDWGMWVHTFNALVPPEVYYEHHPEYFAMVKGKRIPTQLCLANADVLEITVQSLRRKIAENPQAKYWSVSQNDNRDYCTCDLCKAVDEREGSPSGSIVQFVNRVAEQFPDKMISTLAYEYGRHAPKTIKPAENVNIMLCSIEAFRDKPLEDDPKSADFVKDVQDWGRIAKDIIVWDYVIQFNHLISPFPNFHVLKPNLQFFARNGVNAMFEQGNREVGGEFAELRSYLLSKLMWNPDADTETLMNDFLKGYYGAAGTTIRKYIDEMTSSLLKSGQPLRIFGSPNEASTSYLTPELMVRYQQLFDEAERSVKGDSIVLERVRIARLPLNYATMEQAKKTYIGERGVFEKKGGHWTIRDSIRRMIDPFTDLCLRQGVTQIKEWSTTPEDYRSAMYRLFSQGMNEHLAYGKQVTFISPRPDELPDAALTMLTDGIRGSHDYDYNWLSFNGKDLEVIIDLGDIRAVKRIESAYFQYGFWLRLLPAKVDYFLSADGKAYDLVSTVGNTLPIDQYGGFQRDFISNFVSRPARYVKVKAYSIGNTPGWHPGAGRPANMLIDEIVVE